jgi:cytochrome c-type biogenesis protein CcmH/NrfF
MCRQTAAGLSLSFYLTVHLDRKRELLDELIQKYGHFLLVRSPPKSSSGTPLFLLLFPVILFFFFFDSFILFFFLLKSK